MSISNKKNAILKLARSRLSEKQKPSVLAANIVNALTLIHKYQYKQNMKIVKQNLKMVKYHASYHPPIQTQE